MCERTIDSTKNQYESGSSWIPTGHEILCQFRSAMPPVLKTLHAKILSPIKTTPASKIRFSRKSFAAYRVAANAPLAGELGRQSKTNRQVGSKIIACRVAFDSSDRPTAFKDLAADNDDAFVSRVSASPNCRRQAWLIRKRTRNLPQYHWLIRKRNMPPKFVVAFDCVQRRREYNS